MKHKALLWLLFFFAFCSAASSDVSTLHQKELYWISFCDTPPNSPTAFYLMQIDRFGSVVRRPQRIFTATRTETSDCSAAMSYDSAGHILLWRASENGAIIRTQIDSRSLKVVSSKRTTMKTSLPGAFSVTQGSTTHFLATKVAGKGLMALGLSPFGIHGDLPEWHLTPWQIGHDELNQQVGVSADGKMAWWIRVTRPHDYFVDKMELYVQPLDEDGRMAGRPIRLAAEDQCASLGAADITGELRSGVRFVSFVDGPEDCGGSAPDYIALIVIDAQTGRPVEERVRDLYEPPNYLWLNFSQALAIDPKGRFVVFADDEGRLFYISVDSIGYRRGRVKVLVQHFVKSGIDLLGAN